MKQKLVALVWLLLHPCLGIAQDVSTIHPDSLLADLKILATTIRENHPMMNRYTTRERFDNLTLRTGMQITKEYNPAIVYASLSTLVSSIGCGHTYLHPSEQAEKRLAYIQDLPFDIAVIDKSIYISAVHTTEYQPYAGAELYRINEVPADRLVTSSFHYISADGYNLTRKAYLLEHQFSFYLNMLMGNPDSLYIESSAGNFMVRYPTHFTKPASEEAEATFQLLSDVPHTALLTVPHFDDGKAVFKQCFRSLQDQHVSQLIIDLRGNGGGNGNVGGELLSYVIDSTLTYFLDRKTAPLRYSDYIKDREGIMISNQYTEPDSMTRRYTIMIKPQKQYHFDGQLYVLTDRGTFSTGAYVASVLKHITGAIVIGEETGGSAFGIGGGVIAKLTLPNTGLSVRFPLYAWWFNIGDDNTGRGVIPDIPVRRDPDLLGTGLDAELKKAIEVIREGRKP